MPKQMLESYNWVEQKMRELDQICSGQADVWSMMQARERGAVQRHTQYVNQLLESTLGTQNAAYVPAPLKGKVLLLCRQFNSII